MAYGTAVHTWKETGVVPASRHGDVLNRKLNHLETKREELWPDGFHEIPLAYNVVSGEARAVVLPITAAEKVEWKASHGDEWIVGTADFVGLLMGGPWVDDLKTGRHVEWADYGYQQAFYVLAWSLFHYHELLSTRSTITHWPKYPINGKPRRVGRVLDPDFLRDFQNRLKNLRLDYLRLREAHSNGGDVVARLQDGPQCLYCPSKNSCTKGQKYE